MALIACAECGGQLSTQAEACPHCGAKTPKPRRSKVPLILLISLPLIFLTWALTRTPTPDESVRLRESEAIALCWKEQERKSNSPGEARFIAGACEKMEVEFKMKHGRAP